MLRVYQKKINVHNKIYYILYILRKNTILYKLGYIIPLRDINLVKINLKLLYSLLFYYKGILKISDKIYIKIFLLYYFFLQNQKTYNKIVNIIHKN
jgi:hypothetical protein